MRLVGLFAWLLVFLAQPAWAESSQGLEFLEQRLASLAIENPGEYGMAAVDLTTGATVSFNGDRPFPMASTMKIAVAATYLSQVDAGRRSLDDTLGGVSAGQLMTLMMVHSNNRATDQLLAALGGPAVVDAWLHGHGLAGIRVDRTIAQLLSDRRDLHDIRDSSTPAAMLGLLRLVDSGNVLSPQSRAVLLDLMERCATGSNRMRALLPAGARVQHKTGTLNGYTGDVGFLTLPDGRRIAVAFFARYGSNRPAVIATAARAIYDGFAAADDASGLASPQIRQRTQQAASPMIGSPVYQPAGAELPKAADLPPNLAPAYRAARPSRPAAPPPPGHNTPPTIPAEPAIGGGSLSD